MLPRCPPASALLRCCAALSAAFFSFSAANANAQQPPVSKGRTLLLPHTIVSGERATLAVLDADGRLAPGVKVLFSNGDRYTTDATGRALFVAPLTLGVILGSLEGRREKVVTVILSPAEAPTDSMQLQSVPQIASLTDRFEIAGRGFCGGADANQITIAEQSAFVLASSPTFLAVMPPADLEPGRASVAISCGKQNALPFEVEFVSLDLQADASPLKPGVHRTLNVRVQGTAEKVELEAKNLAPAIADLVGGSPRHVFSSGGEQNEAHVEIVGRIAGSFQVSIRLVTPPAH